MANSKLLKDAIADAKAVRETAIANAKIALEEAFTPRLQSILSQKLQQEIEGDNDEEELDDVTNEEYGSEDAPTGDSSSIGAGASADSGTNNKQPSGITTKPHTDLDPETGKISDKVGTEDDNVTVVKEGEGEDEDGDGVIDDPTGATVTEDGEFGDEEEPTEIEDEDELDLESIIKELESELDDEEPGEEEIGVDDVIEEPAAEQAPAEDGVGEEPIAEPVSEPSAEEAPAEDDDIDLDEILKEMGYGEDEDEIEPEAEVTENEKPWDDEKEEELEEAYSVIRSLKGTINEVNLLNAKLLYSNKLFRSYELTNEQKMKVVETLDRTVNVREVKLVFATLAESLKFSINPVKRRKKITESFASNVVASTAPKKEIITESNTMAERFKTLANIK